MRTSALYFGAAIAGAVTEGNHGPLWGGCWWGVAAGGSGAGGDGARDAVRRVRGRARRVRRAAATAGPVSPEGRGKVVFAVLGAPGRMGRSAVDVPAGLEELSERRTCRSWLRAPRPPTGSPVSRTRSSRSRSVEPRATRRRRVRAVALRAHPPGESPRGHDPAPGRRRDPAPGVPGPAPHLLGRLRPLPQGAQRGRRCRRLLGRAHRQAADRRTGAQGVRPPELGRALQGRDGRRARRARCRVRRDQPDRAVHRRCLSRADPARHEAPGDIDAILDQYRTKKAPGSPGKKPQQSQKPVDEAELEAAEGSGAAARTTELRVRRVLPVQALLRRVRQGPHHRHRLRRRHHRADLHLHRLRVLRDRPAERVQPRQAGLEGRLADALGLRGRRLRAERRRPLVSGSSFQVGGQIVGSIFDGKQPIGPMYAFVGISGMAKMSCSKGGVPTPGDALKIMEPQILRWLYARRRPNQSFKIAFDQEIQRLYDEWDKLDAKVADGTALPADVAAHSRAVRTAGATAAHATPAAVPHARLRRRHHRRCRGPDAAHPERARPGRPADLARRGAAPARQGRGLDHHPGAGRPAHHRPRTSPTPSCSSPSTSRAGSRCGCSLDGLADTGRWTGSAISSTASRRSRPASPPTPRPKELPAEIKVAQRTFFALLYHLLVGRDTGPRLPTLLLAVGQERVRTLLGE